MKLHANASALLLALVLSGCGLADGGPIGTGIIASVSGNVVEAEGVLQIADTDDAALGTILVQSGIVVSIDEVPGAETTTDAEGTFVLEGEFAGALTLRFRTADLDATEAIDVPAGAALILSSIEIRGDEISTDGVRTLNVLGQVARIDCDGGELILIERQQERRITVLLDAETVFVAASDGREVACSALTLDTNIAVGGTPERGSPTIHADLIRLDPNSGDKRPPEREEVRFHGVILQRDCSLPGIRIRIPNRDDIFRIGFTEATLLRNRGHEEIPCRALEVGTIITGMGFVDLARPAITIAEVVDVRSGLVASDDAN
ncbi:MAG: hypothetical protein VCC00_00225 [Deltaproteobacteria bacterium]